MTRVASTNYAGAAETTFAWATAGTDRFSREDDLYNLSRAVELHDHSVGKGLSVARVLNGLIGTSQLAAGAVDSTKLATDAVLAIAVALDAIGALELADNAVDTAAIQALAVTLAKMAAGSVDATKVVAGSLTNTQMAAGMALANLGYTPINKAGDSGLGNLVMATTKILQFIAENGVKIDFANNQYTLGVASNTLEIQSDRDIGFRDNSASAGVYAFLMNCLTGQLTIPIATGTAPLVISSTTEVANLNASRVAGKVPTATPAAGASPLADGSGKLDAWITAATGVPSGHGGWVPTAAAIPSGYTRYSNLDGRMPVGAGTTFTVTYVENTNYGASWSHQHTSVPVIVIGNNSNTVTRGGTGSNTPDDPHGHAITSQTMSNVSDAWQIPVRAIVWITKN